MTKSQSLKKKINKIRGKSKPAKRKNGRDISKDNLTDVERNILNMLLQKDEPVSVKDIAVEMFGENVSAEAKGKDSVRTVRNALRIPKAMGLINPVGSGKYEASEEMREWGFKLAERVAMTWKLDRDTRRQASRKEPSDGPQ